MKKRVTIVLDENLVKKLRIMQAKKISKIQESVSFSRIVNEVLEKGLK
jgi:hypothetical protein